MKAICWNCTSVYFNLPWSEPENLHVVAAYAFDYLQATSIPGMETGVQHYVLAIIVHCNRSWKYCMGLFQLWAMFWSKILSHTWPCSKRHFLFWQHNMPLSLGIYKEPFQHSFYFSSYTMKSINNISKKVWWNDFLSLSFSNRNDVCCSIIIFQNSRNVNVPNFHNISSVETRETISSIHCKMKEYIS